ncbi:fatty-acyl-CoA synthase [Actinoalloteichus cyanogriseus DSM 43889]|uniref:Fatty-acyl-CoA synthase n=2 Tax=Actinoalloteichus cyanogriseus TaxID=2893586 RepID=A0ABT1JDH5_ACTCY|nr:fatty-acyl-CoA synthase [Actinoalloteichus caeruleus DSM 43889]
MALRIPISPLASIPWFHRVSVTEISSIAHCASVRLSESSLWRNPIPPEPTSEELVDYVRRVLAGIAPQDDVLVSENRSLNGAETHRLVAGMAAVLARFGVGPGVRVACLHGNTPEAVLLRLAVQWAGGCYVGLRPMFSPTVHAACLAHAAPEVLVHDQQREERATELLRRASVPRVLSLGPSALGEDLAALAAAAVADAPTLPAALDRPASLAYTSGTTGSPKGVVHGTTAMAACLDVARAMYGPPPWRFLVAIPLSDLGGELAQWILACGGVVVLREDLDPLATLALLERERITHLFTAPSSLYQLAEHPDLDHFDLTALRLAVYGGAPAVPARTSAALRRLGPRLMQNYGTQETGFVCALLPEDHGHPELLDHAGRLLPGVEVEIRDTSGAVVPPGVVGEIWVRSPMTMSGYHADPARTGEVLVDGWVRTGDLGHLSEADLLRILDRAKDLIIVEAYNVYSRRVEDVLCHHPKVLQAGVVGLPDVDRGERVCAAVVLASGTADADELREHVEAQLGEPHVPRLIRFVDTIPLTDGGKPDKSALRALFAPDTPSH